MGARQRSVPARTSRTNNAGHKSSRNSRAVVSTSPSIVSTLPTPPQNVCISSKSDTGTNSRSEQLPDALARMTTELNIRAVGAQANRLEQDLRSLVECTSQDKEFRQNHERCLEAMWREILAVQMRMGEVQGTSRADHENCQRQITHLINELKEEMNYIKHLFGTMSSLLGRFPTTAGTNPETGSMYSKTRMAVAEHGASRSRMSSYYILTWYITEIY